MCVSDAACVHPHISSHHSIPGTTSNGNVRVYAIKTIPSFHRNDELEDGDDVKHHVNGSANLCCNSWKRTEVGPLHVKRAAALVTPAKHNYSD